MTRVGKMNIEEIIFFSRPKELKLPTSMEGSLFFIELSQHKWVSSVNSYLSCLFWLTLAQVLSHLTHQLNKHTSVVFSLKHNQQKDLGLFFFFFEFSLENINLASGNMNLQLPQHFCCLLAGVVFYLPILQVALCWFFFPVEYSNYCSTNIFNQPPGISSVFLLSYQLSVSIQDVLSLCKDRSRSWWVDQDITLETGEF